MRNSFLKVTFSFLIGIHLIFCASHKTPPYACGPTMNQKGIRSVFKPLIDFMELKPGDTFADVGASSGYYTVMMATLMENTTFYIQDIDTTCLNNREFNKVIDYYSRQSHKELRKVNSLHYVIGNRGKTNLPENTFDKIYMNATFHALTEPDEMAKDLYERLKSDGSLFVRDGFPTTKEVQYCADKNCARPLIPLDTFLTIMARNKFRLEKNLNFSGYPMYAFKKN